MIPSDAQIRSVMEEMMKVVDLETMSTKQFIAALSTKLDNVDLSTKKKFIKTTITEIIDEMEQGDQDDARREGQINNNDDGSSSDDDDDDDAFNAIDLKPKKRGNTGGLSAIKEISDELSQLLQCGKHMARTAIVKSLWEYIKTNNLQNPNDKREILLDDKMKAVFGVDTFTVRTSNCSSLSSSVVCIISVCFIAFSRKINADLSFQHLYNYNYCFFFTFSFHSYFLADVLYE